MNTKILSLKLISSLFLIVIQFTYSQSGWSLEEETNVSGMVSGTIQTGHIFKMNSGSIYEVTGLTLQLVLELSPKVTVLKKGLIYKLIIKGFDEPVICDQLKVPLIKSQNGSSEASDVIESKISGEFEGWTGETIFKLLNGQIWQQSSYAYLYRYAYSPDVVIYKSGGRYKMKVEGVEETIFVDKLK